MKVGTFEGWARAALCLGVVLLAAPERAAATDSDLKKIAVDLAAKIRAQRKERVLVVDFKNLDGKVDALGKYVAQKLTTQIAEEGLTVVDRSQVQQLLEEIGRADDGLLDPATSRSLGKQTGVEVVISGLVYPSSMSVKVDARAINLETASLVAVVSKNVTRMGTISQMALRAEEEANPALGGPSPTAETAAIPPPPTRVRQAARTLSADNLRLDLQGCFFENDALVCSIQVTNLIGERTIRFHCESHAWDDLGNEYMPSLLRVANSEAACRSHWDYLDKALVSNVPTLYVATYRGVRQDLRSVPQVKLVFEPHGGRADAISFRDVLPGEGSLAANGNSGGSGHTPGAGSAVQPKKGEGLLRRMGRRVGAILEESATRALEREADKLTGGEKPPG